MWARSVGLEVVNELDALKSALMMSAGASSGSAVSPWTIGSQAYESALSSVGGMQNLAQTLGTAAKSLIVNKMDRRDGS